MHHKMWDVYCALQMRSTMIYRGRLYVNEWFYLYKFHSTPCRCILSVVKCFSEYNQSKVQSLGFGLDWTIARLLPIVLLCAN